MSFEFIKKLPTPDEIRAEYPVPEKVREIKKVRDAEIKEVFTGKSDKCILIIGPCSADNEEARYQAKAAMCAQRLEDLKNGEYKLGGGVVDPLPEDAPFFVKDYYDYYKTERGYHPRSLNSNGGWNVIGCESFVNQPILQYSNEIRSAVLLIHGEKAHSCYFSRDAYANMIENSKYTDNKELMIIPDAVHTDLYDGGDRNVIPFDKIQSFFEQHLK